MSFYVAYVAIALNLPTFMYIVYYTICIAYATYFHNICLSSRDFLEDTYFAKYLSYMNEKSPNNNLQQWPFLPYKRPILK